MIRSFPAIILLATAMCGAQTPTPQTHSDSGPAGPAAAQQFAAQQTPVQPANSATPQPAPKPGVETPAPNPGADVPAMASVITIQGLCSPASTAKTGATAATKSTASGKNAAGAPCKTVVTKAQFEKILDAVNPGTQPVAPAMRRNLGQTYVDLLTFSQAAHKAGIDKDPNFNEYMRLLRMKALQDFYRRKLEKEDRNPPESEIEAYYKQNIQKYEQIKLGRIFIPAKNPSAANKDDWEKKAAQEASDIHDRAVKGEDLEKLQKEAYTTLGLTISPPATNTGNRRRGMLAPSEEKELFDLKAGDVSQVEQEPAGYIIYKVDSKETLPEAQVKDEISRELFRQKMESQLKSVNASVHADFNDQYFEPSSPPPAAVRPGRPGPVPPGMREPGERAEPASPGAKPPAPAANPNPPSATTSPATPGQTPPK